MNRAKQYALIYDSKGNINVQLPLGEPTDAYRLYLSVKILNDMGTLTVYDISTPVTAALDNTYAASLTASFTKGGGSAILNSLASQDTASAVSQVLAIASLVSATASDVIKKKKGHFKITIY